jgi:serine/threonine protein kinase
MSAPLASAKAIFLQALELTTATDLEAYLDTQCGSDAFLRREVEDLLRHHQGTEGFLESPPTAVMESVEQLRTMAPQPKLLEFLGPPSRADSLGRLGHYEVLELVGSGGMGIVLKAFDEQLHRVVAIKAMAAPLATSATARQWFVREARAAAAVNHDNVVDIYAVEGTGPVPYLVMEFVAGISLEERLHQQGPLELKEILRIGLQTADGLAAAHRQGVVHRDVKPANILLENGVGRVKITDFGLARVANNAPDAETSVIAGTPAYMSPEQARGDPVDHRSDLFSLGSVLYALCTGQSPFRGSTPLGTLQAVCEEVPPPIRDLNSDIPAWLCEVIKKLLAKVPAERFQSAAELAETLGGYLAHVQQPSNPLPPAVIPAAERPTPTPAGSRPNLRRWAIAAVAALVVMAVTLSLTEAGGVTHLASTVTRIFTPEGTLVVETNDWGVKVTIEGDGGLVITGAGLEEIRLRPGSYHVHADKDGKPVLLDQELVTITRGDKQVVRVRLESTAPVGAGDSPGERNAFVVLDRKGAEVRKCNTLSEAELAASDGDTIEIRGNGPFIADAIDLNNKALTIRAGTGYAPVIHASQTAVKAKDPLLKTEGSLTLEGLELHHEAVVQVPEHVHSLIQSVSAPLYLTHCKLVYGRKGVWGSTQVVTWDSAISARLSPTGQVRNSVITSPGFGVALIGSPRMQWTVQNCLIAADDAVWYVPESADAPEARLRLTRNTLASSFGLTILVQPVVAEQIRNTKAKPIVPGLIESEENVYEAHHLLVLSGTNAEKDLEPSFENVARISKELLRWRERSNVYGLKVGRFLWLHPQDHRLLKDLAEWNRVWALKDTSSVQAPVNLRGNPRHQVFVSPESVTADDFRLREDSAGYRAGPDGKDLGADVDLVGPGAAYERWKKTPEYQEWLKETGQKQ